MTTKTAAVVLGTAIILLAVPEAANAQAGHVHRATRRRTAVVVSTVVREDEQQKAAAANASSQAAAQQSTAAQQSATAQQQSATAAQQSATAQQQTAAAAAAAKPAPTAAGPLAIGTVVPSLPAGCTSMAVGGVEYQHCGNDWYRSAFQGNNLVYVTTAPPN